MQKTKVVPVTGTNKPVRYHPGIEQLLENE